MTKNPDNLAGAFSLSFVIASDVEERGNLWIASAFILSPRNDKTVS